MTLTGTLAWLWANKVEVVTLLLAFIGAASALVKTAEAFLAFLLPRFPGLKGADDELLGLAAWLDAVASSSFLNSLALSPAKVGKTLKVALCVFGLALLTPKAALAGGLDYSVGPSLPFLSYELGGSSTPLQVAPGAGLQFSLTHDSLKVDLGGKAWDTVSLTGMAFGTLVTPGAGQQFGELSAAVAVGFMSNLLSVGVGKHLLAPDAALVHGGWFLVLSLSFNFALAPTVPATFEKAQWWLPRGNTVYLVGGP